MDDRAIMNEEMDMETNEDYIDMMETDRVLRERERVREKYKSYPTFSFFNRVFPLHYHDPLPRGYVYHHILYDHLNPESNIVVLSNFSHGLGHSVLQKLGFEIKHINIKANMPMVW